MASFQYHTVKAFRFLKSKRARKKLFFPIKRSGALIAKLFPISSQDLDDSEAISLLSKWRAENSNWFPAKFPVTDERTKKWLKKAVLDNDDRMIFWILGPTGERWGHIGLANINARKRSCDIDSVMNGGNANAPKGLMTDATITLMRWAFSELKSKVLELEVLGDNLRAIALYLRCGMSVTSSAPLIHIDDGEGGHWERTQDILSKAERYFVRMRIRKEEYLEKFPG